MDLHGVDPAGSDKPVQSPLLRFLAGACRAKTSRCPEALHLLAWFEGFRKNNLF